MSQWWWILHRAPTAALILTLPARQRACEINCIWNLINYEIKYTPWWKNTIEKELKWTRTHAHTLILKVKKKDLIKARTRINEKNTYALLILMHCCLPTELHRKLSKMVKVTYIIMVMYYVTPMIPLYTWRFRPVSPFTCYNFESPDLWSVWGRNSPIILNGCILNGHPVQMTFEPRHVISNNVAFLTSVDSDEPVQPV